MQILSLHGVTAGSKSKSALLDDMLGLCLFHPQRMGSCSSQVPRAITKWQNVIETLHIMACALGSGLCAGPQLEEGDLLHRLCTIHNPLSHRQKLLKAC